jgi:hypothetical protein
MHARLCVPIGTLVLATHVMSAQATRAVRLDAAESAIERPFSGIIGVRELSDGRVLISDLIERIIFVGDFGTKTVAEVGRTGKGPGEYENPDRLYPVGGDSTLMVERRTSRWHVFHRASLVNTIAADDRAVTAVRRLVSGADARGNVIRVLAVIDGTKDPAAPEVSLVIRANRRTGRVDTVTTLRNGRTEVSAERGPDGRLVGVGIRRVPYSVDEEVALFEDGWLAIARTDPYRVDWIDPAGRVVKGGRLPWSGSRITLRDVEAYITRSGTGAVTDAQRREAANWMSKVPPVVPAVMRGGLIAMGDGNLLIRHPPTAANRAARYQIVDRLSRAAGSLTLEDGAAIVAVTTKWAYVVTTNSDGLQYLSRHHWVTP